MNSIEGIVIRNEDYKDADGLIDLVTPQKVITVRAKGIRKAQSKNRMICQPFSSVEWMIEDRGSLPLLINGRVKHFYHSLQSDLSAQALCMVLRDCMLRFGSSPEIFSCFEMVLSSLEKKDSKAYTWSVLLLKEILIHEGIQPYTDGCVFCRRKDKLASLSMKQGGFLCKEHMLGTDLKMSRDELIRIYSLFHVMEKDKQRFIDTYPFTIEDIIYWSKWIEHYSHISLGSIRFLETVWGMD